MGIQLIAYEDADYDLTVALETDPQVMGELGGPRPLKALCEVHRRRLEANRRGNRWLKIILGEEGPAVGTIGFWPSEWNGEPIHETGWMILPRYQGRGLASSALGELLALARRESKPGTLHAFPSVGNEPSNALCRSAGFELAEGDVAGGFAGHTLRCNHWVLRLT